MFHTPTLPIRFVLLSLMAIAIAPGAIAETVVIPNAQTSVEGNEANVLPFGRTVTSNEPYRYQQVYNASGFGEQSAPITIDEIRFRTDSNNTVATTITVGSLEVRLSTTQAAADGLDNVTFDNNIGPDATLVYAGGLLWPIPLLSAPPHPFEQTIVLTTPFEYDPSAGNLLLEIYNLSEVFPFEYTLDLQNTLSDEVSRAVENVVPSTGAHVIATPQQNQSRGLVTQFVYNTPEAGTLGAGVVALCALVSLRRSRIA